MHAGLAVHLSIRLLVRLNVLRIFSAKQYERVLTWLSTFIINLSASGCP